MHIFVYVMLAVLLGISSYSSPPIISTLSSPIIQHVHFTTSSSSSFASPSFNNWTDARFPHRVDPACPVYFTVDFSAKDTGLGDHVKFYLTGVKIARELGFTWVHSPFTGNSAVWEPFLGLGRGEITAEEIGITENVRSAEIREERIVVGSIREFGRVWKHASDLKARICGNSSVHEVYLVRAYPTFYELRRRKQMLVGTRDAFVRKYEIARNSRPVQFPLIDQSNANVLNIAVHYRLGDLAGKGSDGRFVGINVLKRTIRKVCTEFLNASLYDTAHVHIFTQQNGKYGSEEFFRPIKSLLETTQCDLKLHIDTKAEPTFDAMVTSDLFIGWNSGFSVAAFYLRSKPSLIRAASGHSGVLNNAVQLNQNGDFDVRSLINLFNKKI